LFDLVRRSLPGPVRTLAAAADGDPDALQTLAEDEQSLPFLVRHRMVERVAAAARDARPQPGTRPVPEAWRKALMRSAANRLQLEFDLRQIGEVLGALGIEWMSLKGMAFSRDIVTDLAERPTTDLDVLVLPEHVEQARRALSEQGWLLGETGSVGESFVRSEGYNWKLVSPRGVSLELHFRLWGVVPEPLAREIFLAATPDESLGPGARCPTLADMYLLAAVHAWLNPGPPPLLYFWDLVCFARSAHRPFEGDVIGRCERWGLQLFVAPSAAIAAVLWGGEADREIASATVGALRWPERLALRRLLGGLEGTRSGLELLVGARLLAGRPSRSGVRAAWRRLWPHRWVLDGRGRGDRSWLRRWVDLVSALRRR